MRTKGRRRFAAANIELPPHLPARRPPPFATPKRRPRVPAMKPPAKRMRIMQSIGVDETHPDYIEGMKQNNEWMQNKFGSILAKYEAMSDMMSDEWDMRDGKVVVDRGHAKEVGHGVPETTWPAGRPGRFAAC